MSYISNKIQITDSYTFDDVLLLPSYADFDRSDISLETILHPKLKLKLPILSSPMDTVTESKMAIVLAKKWRTWNYSQKFNYSRTSGPNCRGKKYRNSEFGVSCC